jgi:hypothetical protein
MLPLGSASLKLLATCSGAAFFSEKRTVLVPIPAPAG